MALQATFYGRCVGKNRDLGALFVNKLSSKAFVVIPVVETCTDFKRSR
jgi:hypothetical protein